ncbi:MAG: hypothetical protein ACPGRZ_10850 [Alphaproteobacteria bacterium]
MTPLLREGLRYVTIGLAFGLIWAVIQYTNGSITDFKILAGPVIVFGAAGLLMWGIRRAVIALRNR